MNSNSERVIGIFVDQRTEDIVAAAHAVRVGSPYELSVKEFVRGVPYARITFLRLGNAGYAEMIVQGGTDGSTAIEVYLHNEKWETLQPIWQAIENRLRLRKSAEQPIPMQADSAESVSHTKPISLSQKHISPSGRPLSACNVWARKQFEQGKGIREIQDEYARLYNEEKPNNATTPEKELQRVHKEWKRKGEKS